MELFKSKFFKKEYENFKKNELLKVLECGLCMKTSCDKTVHYKYEPNCNRCKEEFCKNCKNFRIGFELFSKNTDEIGKDYLKNFISDFLNISSLSLQNFFPEMQIKTIISVEKSFTIKSYNKSQKNRDRVVNQELNNVERINYRFKRKQRKFYKNF